MSTKTHYRKVFKSDHLGCADLEEYLEQGKQLIFTIREVKQEIGKSVAGKRGDFNIAYFVEQGVKPLVLNATNSKIVKSFCSNSPFVEDWINVRVELFIDETVKMKGEVIGGVRIKPVQPVEKQKPIFETAKFEAAKLAGATIESIEKHYQLTEEIKKQYIDYVAKNNS